MNDKNIYVKTLNMSSILGRKDCDIFYVRHEGDFVGLMRECSRRNIRPESISMKEYRRVMRNGVMG